MENGEGECEEDDQGKDSPRGQMLLDRYLGRDLSAKKGIDRWPMFSINIDLSRKWADVRDVFDNRGPELSIIVDLVKSMFHEFLKRHHYQPKVVRSSQTRSNNGPGGDMGLGKIFNDPGMITKLENHPKTKEYMNDPTFRSNVARLQSSGGRDIV